MMDLYKKQDFTPPILSRRWIAIMFRPNMLLHSLPNIITILESGLMFREDSIEVEQESQCLEAVRREWLTRGEGALSAAALAACISLFLPRSFNGKALINLSVYAAIPVAIRATHRALGRSTLSALLRCMSDYLALARRAAACLKEFTALHSQLDSFSYVIESTRTMLCRQQSELALSMARATSAVLGNAPWLKDDVDSFVLPKDDLDNFMKVHHAFLVVQSTLLKHIAMAHYVPPPNIQKLYKNHNERLYWMHTTLIHNLLEEFKTNFEALERMYRLLKNFGSNNDLASPKKLGQVKSNWVFSEVHTGIARACLELKLALNKSNDLDVFLDTCALNNQTIEMDILNKDVDDLIEHITKSLTTVQNSQIRLNKLRGKIDNAPKEAIEVVESAPVLQLEDTEPEVKDEVFYFVKTEDDETPVQSTDYMTEPGNKEKETSKIVLNELKRKLGKREDLMRERERQALVKTMPDLENIPEFPRQIEFDEFVEKKGYISKIKPKDEKKKLFKNYKIKPKCSKSMKKKNDKKLEEHMTECEVKDCMEDDNKLFNLKSKLFTLSNLNNKGVLHRRGNNTAKVVDLGASGMSSDVEANTSNKIFNQAVNIVNVKLKVNKKDLELTESSSDSDSEYYKNQRALLNDIRRHRLPRRRNYPKDRSLENVDESLRPIEYCLGAGLAMASVLQGVNPNFSNMAEEEVFNGDGEVSDDSGNDDDA